MEFRILIDGTLFLARIFSGLKAGANKPIEYFIPIILTTIFLKNPLKSCSDNYSVLKLFTGFEMAAFNA